MHVSVLLINTEQYLSNAIEYQLLLSGCSLLRAEGAFSAWLFEHKKPDLLVVGAEGGTQTGFDILLGLGVRNPKANVPMLMLGARLRNSAIRSGILKRYRLIDYLESPVEIDRLLEHIDRIGSSQPTGKDLDFWADYPQRVLSKKITKVARTTVLRNLQDLSFGGSLALTPAPELLVRCVKERKEGAIKFKWKEQEKIVFMQEGLPVFVTSNCIDERLGNLLVRDKLLLASQRDRSLQEMERTGTKLGEVLVRQGWLTVEKVQQALQKQLTEKILDLFSWENGTFSFSNLSPPATSSVGLRLAPETILYFGIKHRLSPVRIANLLEPYQEDRVKPLPGIFETLDRLPLQKDELEALNGLTGSRTLRELRHRALSKEALDRVLYTLLCLRLIRFQPPKTKSKISLVAKSQRPLQQTLMRLCRQNYFERLGVPKNATDQQIARSFLSRAKPFGPDRIRLSNSSEDYELRLKIFSCLREAFQAIAHSNDRKTYLDKLPDSTKTPKAKKSVFLID